MCSNVFAVPRPIAGRYGRAGIELHSRFAVMGRELLLTAEVCVLMSSGSEWRAVLKSSSSI